MNELKKTFKFFDRLEDKIRARLSRRPVLYALIGSVGIVFIWRGIWMMADDMDMPGWVSLLIGVLITMVTGLFVSFFIGDRIIISGLKEEKRIDEKTTDEIKNEEATLALVEQDLREIKEEILEINNEHIHDESKK